MVARITTPRNINAALNYNEAKVSRGKAECLYAGNFLKEAQEMNFYQKLQGFERLNVLNDRAATKTLHVSLNFNPSEKLSNHKLINIASDYMKRIGFEEQPFLIYKHEDAGHPHIHIVSTTIKGDGSRINTHNMGRNQSEKARRELENIHDLLKAEKRQGVKAGMEPVEVTKAIYGKAETKRSISNIVSAVYNQYKCTSLPEFNAALKQFNVVADRGKEGGRIYKNRGLVYRMLDDEGATIGVPIKASSIACSPTLHNLESKFAANGVLKEFSKQRLKSTLDDSLVGAHSMKEIITGLGQKGVYALPRHNGEGRLYGITFVDNNTKCVFNGSDLGKQYSAAALQSRLANPASEKAPEVPHTKLPSSAAAPQKKFKLQQKEEKPFIPDTKAESLLDALLSVKEQNTNLPSGLLKKKRRKRQRNDPNL